MRIRLHGTKDECRRTAEALATVVDILAASRPSPDRPASPLVRLYLTTTPPTEHAEKET
ncbi:hypothetical protein [Streptomyces sp. NPDC001380]|uniref:hypothetical protein n=1 Tax=Streptomyces sp. NPDC001380 TaxID=3364566 RepID=UPI0036AD9D35